jgi:hypothetical protein
MPPGTCAMAQNTPPQRPLPPGSIEFEPTDFGDARRALDELPAGIAEVQRLRAGDWEAQRRKSLPTDRALTGAAMDWVIGLPQPLRPRTTCELFPRVVNLLAESWGDARYSVQVIDHMVNDYRGGRRGFPAPVLAELNALYEYQRKRAGA